jgi:tRNA(Ile)-lysidine synthetase-like protein
MLSHESTESPIAALTHAPFPTAGRRVMVAISGGPDSTALLIAAFEAGHEVVAAHYDHALREGSHLVADQVAQLCRRLGVELHTERRSGVMPAGSLQARARALRYDFLDRAATTSSADSVALAHTADDLVEGAVLHLMRGCGLAGLRGMPASRGRYVRPWLRVWRREVEEFLARRGVVAYEDPANVDTRFARARVRRLILPQLEQDRPGIVRRIHSAATRAALLHEAVATEAKAAIDAGRCSDSDLRSMPEPVAVEMLKLLYVRAGGAAPGLSRAQLAAMLRLAGGGRGGRGIDLPGGLRFRIVGHVAEFVPAAQAARGPSGAGLLEVRRCSGCGDPEAAHFRLGLDLRVGFRQPGLRMRPAGGRGSRKLQDILVDAKVPREERDGWPLVFAGDRLAWVPGIAVDRDLASRPGELSQHVSLSPMPVRPVKLLV